MQPEIFSDTAVVFHPVISLDVEFVVSVAPEGPAIILDSLALDSGHGE